MTIAREKPPERPCEYCGGLFQPSRRGVRCCSYDCGQQRWYAANIEKQQERSYRDGQARKKPRQKKTCAVCTAEFLTGYGWQRTCSKACWWKLHYQENAEDLREKAKRTRAKTASSYRKRDRETWRKMREERGKSTAYAKARCPWLPLLTGARHRAAKQNLAFDLTREWCDENWTGSCSLTKIKFELNAEGRNPYSPSLDKIDPAKGYTQTNCRFVLWGINAFKYTGTDAQMYRAAKALIENWPAMSIPPVHVDWP